MMDIAKYSLSREFTSILTIFEVIYGDVVMIIKGILQMVLTSLLKHLAGTWSTSIDKCVFRVFHVNRSVNIFLLHRIFFLFTKDMLTDMLTWNT